MLNPFHLAEIVRNHKIDGQYLVVGLRMLSENMTAVLTGTDKFAVQTKASSQAAGTTIDVVAPMKVYYFLAVSN